MSPPAIRAAAEKDSGAITAAPAPSRVKPSTATGQVGANTTTASAADETTAPTRSTRTTPCRATSASPANRKTRLARRYGNVASATSPLGVGNVLSRYVGPQVEAAVSTM